MQSQSPQKILLTKDLCKQMLKDRRRNNLLIVIPFLFTFLYLLISGISAQNYLFCALSGVFFLCFLYSYFKSGRSTSFHRIYLVRDEVFDIEKCLVRSLRGTYTEHNFFFRRFGTHCIRGYDRPAGDLSQQQRKFSLQALEQNSLEHFHRGEEFYLLICEKGNQREIARIFSTQTFDIDLADFALQGDCYPIK